MPHRRPLRLAVLAALMALSMLTTTAPLAAAHGASAPAGRAGALTPLGGVAWNVSAIRVYDTTPRPYREGINLAIRSWNDAKVGVRFVRTTNRGSAHLVVRTKRLPGSVAGMATLGRATPATMWLDSALVAVEPVMDGRTIVDLPGGAVPELVAEVAAHELGHVLGLKHTRGCSLMTATGLGRCGYSPPDGMWTCRLPQRADVRPLARRYGGPGIVRAALYCPRSATPAGRVGAVTSAPADRERAVSLDWREVTNRYGYVVARSAPGETCPATPDSGAARRDIDHAGLQQSWSDLAKVRARYCFSIWSRNGRGTLTGPTTKVVDVVPPLAAPIRDFVGTFDGSNVLFSWTSPPGTRAVRIYRSDVSGEMPCEVPRFLPITQAVGSATTASEREAPSGTWTYVATRSDDAGEAWASAPVCVTVTVP